MRRAVKEGPREVHEQEECRIEQGELCFPLQAHLETCITYSQLKYCDISISVITYRYKSIPF